jgi:hypothetical protein
LLLTSCDPEGGDIDESPGNATSIDESIDNWLVAATQVASSTTPTANMLVCYVKS